MSGDHLKEGRVEEPVSVDMEAITHRKVILGNALDDIESVVAPLAEARPASEDPVQYTETYAAAATPDQTPITDDEQLEGVDSQIAERPNLTVLNNPDYVADQTALEQPDLALVTEPHENLDGTEVFAGGPKAGGMSYEAASQAVAEAYISDPVVPVQQIRQIQAEDEAA